MKVEIGILGLQGSFIEHKRMLERIGNVNTKIVKTKEDLDLIQGLILPGGESTTIGNLLINFDLKNKIIQKIEEGMMIWGTCAGMILLAKRIINDTAVHLGVMDITVKRNAYGSQLNSFIAYGDIPQISKKAIPLVFIRAPYIEEIGSNVEILCEIEGKIVGAKQNNIMVTSFHPELTDNIAFHKYFVNLIRAKIR